MSYVIAPPPLPSLAVDGTSDRFPVRRIWCVGRNYAAHAKEMGATAAVRAPPFHPGGAFPSSPAGQSPSAPPPPRAARADKPEAPFFFAKPADALVPGGGEVPYPPATANLHHEVELVVAVGEGGRDVPVEEALRHVYGYAVGLDLTRRDLQEDARRAGRPWDMAKGFDHAAPCSALRRAAIGGHPEAAAIWLDVNGARRQSANVSDMIWRVPEILSHLSRLVALAPGDLVYTGTPAGVGPIVRGDRLHGHVDGVGDLEVTIL